MRELVLLMACMVAVGCGSTPHRSASAEGSSAATAGAETNVAEPTNEAPAAVAAAPEEPTPRQGDVIDGGSIARARLRAVLDAGIARFLQQVRVEADRQGARFVGWRLLSIFDDARFAHGPVRVGDTLLGINGRIVERPEQLFAVWETLVSVDVITLQVLRDGQAYEVRYAIVD